MPRRADLVVAGWLALQLALPLAYYLGGDPLDERFAWRMFSTVRLTRCEVTAAEVRSGEEALLRLSAELQAAWITQLARGQPRVTERFVRDRCERPGVEAVRIERRCRQPDGSRHVDPRTWPCPEAS